MGGLKGNHLEDESMAHTVNPSSDAGLKGECSKVHETDLGRGTGSSSAEIVRFRTENEVERTIDHLAVEEPMEIRVKGQSIVMLMRTPGHDHELAAGFLVTEGIIRERDDLLELAHCTSGRSEDRKNVVNAYLHPRVGVDMENRRRYGIAGSSCGLCGKATMEAVHLDFEKVTRKVSLSSAFIRSLSGRTLPLQSLFRITGGVHAAALAGLDGRLLGVWEDVGRHNALDKLIGHFFLKGPWPLTDCILLVSGRCSFEIVQKALAAGIGVIAAVSAPTNLAVEFARKSNQLLIGFLRDRSFVVYSNAESVVD